MNTVNAVTTTITKLNWRAILNNATNRNFWKQKFCIYEYGQIKVVINVYELDIESNNLVMKLVPILRDLDEEGKIFVSHIQYGNYQYIYLPMAEDHFNETIFNEKLFNAVQNSINACAKNIICSSDRYIALDDLDDQQNEMLRNIAIDFLDDEGVTNDDIRTAYVESYVDKMFKSKTEAYVEATYPTLLIPEHVSACYFLERPDAAEKYRCYEIDDEDAESNYQKCLEEAQEAVLEANIEDLKDQLEEI
jgi:hypothetical protein